MSQDREWADAVLTRRDERSFRRLYRCHTPRLHSVVMRLLSGKRTEAEDVVQETWFRAVSRLSQFRWESAFATWLTGIGLNLCRERLRKRRPGPELSDAFIAPAPRTGGSALRLDLERALSALPEGYRTVLILHDVEGYTHREIAAWLGVTEGTSKSQLFSARKRMRALLNGHKERNDESPRRAAME